MEISVKLFGLVDVLEEREARLSLPAGASVGDVIQGLVNRFGNRLKERLLRGDGRLQDSVRVVVGEEMVDRLEQKLERETSVFIIHEIAGGSGSPSPPSAMLQGPG